MSASPQRRPRSRPRLEDSPASPDAYIEPALAPIGRLLDHLATEGHTRPISLRTFTFLVAPKAATTYANETADLIINALRPEDDS